jgi:hypothetical protein
VRNYLTRDIWEVSNIIDVYQPTSSRTGNAKQFQAMTKSATGVDIKNGQASLAVSGKCSDTIEAQIGQYMWLPLLIKAYEDSDPAGTYVLESETSVWKEEIRQFHRAYLCMSTSRHFWRHANMNMVVCDGTFTKLKAFRHIILLAVTFDGQNQVMILAFAIVNVENADNWVWFKEKLDEDCPGFNVWMSDADKGITSSPFQESLSLTMSQDDSLVVVSRCTRHLAENCSKACKGSMNEEQKRLVLELAFSRTEEAMYQERLKKIKSINPEWAVYLDEKKDQFVTLTFLDKGIRRFGKVTSNGVENINSAIVNLRAYPIIHMVEALTEYQRKKYYKCQKQSKVWLQENRIITPYASFETENIAKEASKRCVEMIEYRHPMYRGRVNVTDTTMAKVEVSVDVDTFESECPCKYREEHGRICQHIKALLLRIGGRHGTDTDWTHERYHVSTYVESYKASIPGMATAGKLRADINFGPPDHKRSAGRPSKKRKQSARKMDIKRKCKACGDLGHFESSCTNPSTEYRWTEHKDKVIEWCRKMEAQSIV